MSIFYSSTDSEQSPGVYLRDDPLFGTHLQNQSELRVHSAEKAAFYLDAALAARAREEGKDSHLLYTLHVYQYSVGGKGAGEVQYFTSKPSIIITTIGMIKKSKNVF